MADDSPFPNAPLPESERTVFRPRPGARGAGPNFTPLPEEAPAPDLAEPLRPPGANPLLASAHALLALVARLRANARVPDPNALREQLASGIAEFEQEANRRGAGRDSIIAARYVLCTLLDETAASTPWGGGGAWAADTLLVRFHNESWGGEKVFQLLSKLAEDPARNIDLLELIYVCLALGFEGRFRVVNNGRAQLDQLRERLYQMLRAQRPAPERSLSPHWTPTVVQRRRWLSVAPFWAFGALITLIVLGAYLVYSQLLTYRSDPVFSTILSLRPNQRPVAQAVAPAPKPRLSKFLEAEIRDGLVAVREDATKSVVTLRGDVSFDPGSAVVSDRMAPVLERIGDGLRETPGRVLISGHTDSQPIRSPRFPSNWHLSQERARAVLQALARKVAPARLQAEGRADGEPVASNDTAAGRAMNRRVEISLVVTQ